MSPSLYCLKQDMRAAAGLAVSAISSAIPGWPLQPRASVKQAKRAASAIGKFMMVLRGQA